MSMMRTTSASLDELPVPGQLHPEPHLLLKQGAPSTHYPLYALHPDQDVVAQPSWTPLEAFTFESYAATQASAEAFLAYAEGGDPPP